MVVAPNFCDHELILNVCFVQAVALIVSGKVASNFRAPEAQIELIAHSFCYKVLSR